MELKQISRDLKDIKYYYTTIRKSQCVNNILSVILKKVEMYSELVKNAPAKLIDLYVNLYQTDASQISYAIERSYTPEYICKMNKELIIFIAKELNKKEQAV